MSFKVRIGVDIHHFVCQFEALLQADSFLTHPHERLQGISLLVLLLLVSLTTLADDAEKFVKNLFFCIEANLWIILDQIFKH